METKVNLPPNVLEIIEKLKAAGFESYAVGGGIRDLLLNRKTANWDFTTNASPQQIQQIFPNSFYTNTFGTVTVIEEKNGKEEKYEITTYRVESSYADFRHPDRVLWGETLREDLSRREFTISAIAVGANGELIDPYDGRKDLQTGLVRAVGDPDKRFGEDALRLIRAVRIATQLGFIIEEKTWKAITQNSKLINQISNERIRDELIKILSADFPSDGVRLLYNAGLLERILPELVKGVGVSQKGTHHPDDVFEHCLKCLQTCQNPNWVVRFATLIHDIGKPVTYQERNGKATFYSHETVGASIAKQIADRLHFRREDREKIYMLVRWHMFSVSEFLTDAAVRRFIHRVGPENTTDMLDLRTADRLGSGVKQTSWRHEDFKKRIIEVQKHIPSVTDLKVDGHDVMKILGIGPGPKVGEILSKLFEEITENPKKNERKYLLKRIVQLSIKSINPIIPACRQADNSNEHQCPIHNFQKSV